MIQAKDSHYNNRPGEELKKGTFDPNKLRYELSIVDTNMAMFSGDYSVQLQAPVSGDEMFLPVRNRSCVGSASCIWPLNDLFDYLKNNTFVDTDGELCYYCINCFKNGGMSNKRSFSKLYLDKELSLYIAQARQHYTQKCPQDKLFKLFKKGTIRFTRTGTIEYWFKRRMEGGWENICTILKDPRKLAQVSNIFFTSHDYLHNPENLRKFIENHSKVAVRKLTTQLNFSEAVGGVNKNGREKLIQSVCDSTVALYSANVTLRDFQDLRSTEFTFGFVTPTHYSEYMQDVNYMVVFYPYYQLWRKFHLKFNKTEFPPIDAAVYLRHGNSVYVVGGARIRYETTKDPKFNNDVSKRIVKNMMGCLKISLKEVNPLKPTKIIKKEMKPKAIRIKGESPNKQLNESVIASSDGTPPKSKIHSQEIIGEMYPQDINAVDVATLPQAICMAAGVVHNNCLYVFGGCRHVSDAEEELLNAAYKLDLSKNPLKWQKLKPLPTPRRSHFVVAYNDRLYIVGGVSEAKIAVPPTCKIVDIYNPSNDSYETKPLVQNPFITISAGQLFANRGVACRLSNFEYLIVNGDRSNSYVFNARDLTYRLGAEQIALSTMASGWKQTNASDKGPKLQQIFDMHPIKYNGYFYYMHNSLTEEMVRVVYGDGGMWSLTEENDLAKDIP